MEADRSHYINDTSKCCICEKPSLFVLEWYSVNQYGKNPEIWDDRGVCGSFEHLVYASKPSEHNGEGSPDAVFLKRSDDEQAELLEIIIGVLNPKNARLALENTVRGEELVRKIKILLSDACDSSSAYIRYKY